MEKILYTAHATTTGGRTDTWHPAASAAITADKQIVFFIFIVFRILSSSPFGDTTTLYNVLPYMTRPFRLSGMPSSEC